MMPVMKTFKIGLAGIALVLAVSGCGGDDNKSGGPACNAFTPCGGDVVGTWQVKDSCMQGKLTVDGCPTASITFDGVKTTGTMTFNADKTGTASITTTGGVKMSLPQSCLAGQTCASIDAVLKTELATETMTEFSSVACSGTDPCTCVYTLKGTPSNDGGSWSTSGSVLTQGTDKADYCVAGQELKVKSRPAGMSTSMMAMDDLTLSVILTKK
jgi:hypothetical protein